MGYFDKRENVDQYLQMAEGYDGRELIAILQKHLPAGASVLELGMGPGKDLDLLAESYNATGSDSSDVFLDLYRDAHPTADLLNLDAVTVETDRTFDCIYSNKVLHHLARLDLHPSFVRQWEILAPGGLMMHSFWHGDGEEEHHGLRFVYYTEETLLDAIAADDQVVATGQYRELEDDDSFYVLLRRARSG